MRHQGTLIDWDDARGFGFVQPHGGGERCFVHIRAFAARDRRPANGMVITYEVQRDPKGRCNAVAVRFAVQRDGTRRLPSKAPGRDWLPRSTLAVGFLGGLAAGVAALGWPVWILFAYLAASGVTFLFYWQDKIAARRDKQRTPEKTLQLLSLLSGWPGALIAQSLLRHKNRKTSFQVVFWAVVIVNVSALVWWLKGATP